METTIKNKSFIQPRTMAELLPGISGILSDDAIQFLTAKKQPRTTIAQTRTVEKVMKPLTIAEMKAHILALRQPSPRRNLQPNTSTKKNNWNSSVKPENKTKSVTANGQINHTSVRKVLNFQPKTKPVTNVRSTPINSETPKFANRELKSKKSLHIQAKNGVRMSGVYNILPTPVVQNKPKPHSIMQHKNKENKPYQANLNRKTVTIDKNLIQKKLKSPYPGTPISNLSIKSNSDASFLRNEKEIDLEEKSKMEIDCQLLDKIAEVTPPVSTPFKEYRDVEEYFNNSCDMNNTCNDNTIMCFDKVSSSKENTKIEESVIVSLCEMMNKAAFMTTDKINTELNDLLQVEKQTENNIKMIENGIMTLNNIKESQITSLQYVRKMINEKKNKGVKSETNLDHIKIETPVKNIKSPILRPSVIISKSPSYKIPRKNMSMRKKIISKSMPNVSERMQTPVKSEDKILDMYMKIKEKMNFLNTPIKKTRLEEPQGTPSVTSHNLQKQLDKLYKGN